MQLANSFISILNSNHSPERERVVFSKITLLTGPNTYGKNEFLYVLHLLKGGCENFQRYVCHAYLSSDIEDVEAVNIFGLLRFPFENYQLRTSYLGFPTSLHGQSNLGAKKQITTISFPISLPGDNRNLVLDLQLRHNYQLGSDSNICGLILKSASQLSLITITQKEEDVITFKINNEYYFSTFSKIIEENEMLYSEISNVKRLLSKATNQKSLIEIEKIIHQINSKFSTDLSLPSYPFEVAFESMKSLELGNKLPMFYESMSQLFEDYGPPIYFGVFMNFELVNFFISKTNQFDHLKFALSTGKGRRKLDSLLIQLNQNIEGEIFYQGDDDIDSFSAAHLVFGYNKFRSKFTGDYLNSAFENTNVSEIINEISAYETCEDLGDSPFVSMDFYNEFSVFADMVYPRIKNQLAQQISDSKLFPSSEQNIIIELIAACEMISYFESNIYYALQNFRPSIFHSPYALIFRQFIIKDLTQSLRYTNTFNRYDYIATRSSENYLFNVSNEWHQLLVIAEKLCSKSGQAYEKAMQFIRFWLVKFNIAQDVRLERDLNNGFYQIIFTKGDKKDIGLFDCGIDVFQITNLLFRIATITTDEVSIRSYHGLNRNFIIQLPEAFLHPTYHSVLANLFAEVSVQFDVDFTIETNSEYLLREFQNILKQNSLLKDDELVVNYFDGHTHTHYLHN